MCKRFRSGLQQNQVRNTGAMQNRNAKHNHPKKSYYHVIVLTTTNNKSTNRHWSPHQEHESGSHGQMSLTRLPVKSSSNIHTNLRYLLGGAFQKHTAEHPLCLRRGKTQRDKHSPTSQIYDSMFESGAEPWKSRLQ